MSTTLRFVVPVYAFGSLILAAAQNSQKPQLTARELFYSAATDTKAQAKATPKASPKANPAKKADPPATVAMDSQSRPTHTDPKPVSGGAKVIPVVATTSTAPAPATGTPLGLKYSIRKLSGDAMVEVAPDTVFHAGDKIQLSVQTNGPGYLYIISQGSSGTWKPMFPSTEVEEGNNKVDGWHAYAMPPNTRMVFDEQTGTEKIFVVFSREPEADLESMIYSLQSGKGKPVVEPKNQPKEKKLVQLAAINIDDTTVGHLRNAYARDLIIERVDDKTPTDKSANQKETAIYVVNPSGSANSRVVADLKLVHQ